MRKLVAHEGEVHEVVELPKDVAFWDEPVIEVLIFAYPELLHSCNICPSLLIDGWFPASIIQENRYRCQGVASVPIDKMYRDFFSGLFYRCSLFAEICPSAIYTY